MKRKGIAVFASLILTASLLGACNTKQETKEENTVLISVEAETIKSKNLEQYITVSSKVEAESMISVIPKASGTVKSVNVSLGDYVNKGDVLFTIDDKDIRLQLNQAQAALNSAKANYNLSVDGNIQSQIEQLSLNIKSLEIQYDDILRNLQKTEELYLAGAVAKNELDNLKSNAETVALQLDTARKNLQLTQNSILSATEAVSNSGIEQARVGVEVAQSQLDYTSVRAEISGVVSNINVSQGQLTSSQSLAMTISDMDSVKLAFQVSEEVIGRIQQGSKAYVTIQAVSNTPIEAEITNLSKVADSISMMYPVELKISNNEQTIKPGMFASVRLILSDKKDVITLPLNTVIYKNEESFVYTVDSDNIAHKTIVETGISNDEVIEITAGLSLGDRVVVKGQDFISDGLKLNVIEASQDK